MLEKYVVVLRVRRQGGEYCTEYVHRDTRDKEVSHGNTLGRAGPAVQTMPDKGGRCRIIRSGVGDRSPATADLSISHLVHHRPNRSGPASIL